MPEPLTIAHELGWLTQAHYFGAVDPTLGLHCFVLLDGPHAPLLVRGTEVTRTVLACLLHDLAGMPIDPALPDWPPITDRRTNNHPAPSA